MYLEDLALVLQAAARVLAPAGLVAFSVETHNADGAILRETLRYAHSAAHVGAALEAAGLEILSLDSAATRTEKKVPVPGLIIVASR
jgi:predicted TPR repeat methyltransferase